MLFEAQSLPEAGYDRVKTGRDVAAAQLDQARAALAGAKQMVADTVIVAPFDGVVTAKFHNAGDTVTLMPVTPIVTVTDVDHLEVRLAAPESIESFVRAGQVIEGVLTPSGQRFQAKVRMKGSVVDPQSRTIEVLADVLKGRGPAIRPGSLANVDFGGFGEKDGLYLPAGAVRTDAKGAHRARRRRWQGRGARRAGVAAQPRDGARHGWARPRRARHPRPGRAAPRRRGGAHRRRGGQVNPIRTFIARPVFTGMLTLVLIVFGIVAYPRIGVDQFPEVDFPIVTVTTILPGADPETIERNVTKPLEEALNTLPGLDTLRSVNVENVSQVVIRFDLERKVDVAAQDVRDRVQATLSKLPREIQTPIVEKFDIGAAPVATLAFSAPLPIERLTKVADDVVKPALQQIPGVGAVELAGGRKREITVVVEPEGPDRLRTDPERRGPGPARAEHRRARRPDAGVRRGTLGEGGGRGPLGGGPAGAHRGEPPRDPGAARRRGPGGGRPGRGPQLGGAGRPERHRARGPQAVRRQHRPGGRAGQGGAGRHPGAASRRAAGWPWWWTGPSSSAPPSPPSRRT